MMAISRLNKRDRVLVTLDVSFAASSRATKRRPEGGLSALCQLPTRDQSSGNGSLVAAATPCDQSCESHNDAWQASPDDWAWDSGNVDVDGAASGTKANIAVEIDRSGPGRG